jgi:hypothetical protein
MHRNRGSQKENIEPREKREAHNIDSLNRFSDAQEENDLEHKRKRQQEHRNGKSLSKDNRQERKRIQRNG